MLVQKLHGLRYSNARNEDLATFIVSSLHGLDYGEAVDFYEKFRAKATYNDIAFLGCNDRFFLLTGILNRRDAMHSWLYDRCREVEIEPDGYLDLWAREHYKSTVITYAGAIQEIVRDPEITIGLFSFNAKSAKAFLKQIKNEFDNNATLRRCYSDLMWDRAKTQAPSWSLDGGITVRRRSNPKEATIEATGLVDGMPTGKHYRLMIYDDIVTDKTVTNPEQVRRATEAWELSDNLGANEVRKWHIGTRYSFADPYGLLLDRKAVVPRIYPATDNGEIDGKPVFISVKRWEEKKRNQRSTLAAQMLQNPLAGRENMFMPTWFRAYQVRPSTLNVYIMGDPSKGKNKSSDRTAFAVVGIDAAGNKYLLDGVRHRMSLSQRWDTLKMLYRKWKNAPGVQMVKVGYESYGQQTDGEYFKEKMLDEDVSFEMIELNWTRDGTTSKKDRVGRLEPDFRLGRFFLPAVVHGDGTTRDGKRHVGNCLWWIDDKDSKVAKSPMLGFTRKMQDMVTAGARYRVANSIKRVDEDGRAYDVTLCLIEEMTYFPFAPKDDLVDACSRIYDMEPLAPSIGEERMVEQLLDELVD